MQNQGRATGGTNDEVVLTVAYGAGTKGQRLRMATLAAGGRIAVEDVQSEVSRLEFSWERPKSGAELARYVSLEALLGKDAIAKLDCFYAVQLAEVVRVCGNSMSCPMRGERCLQRAASKSAAATMPTRPQVSRAFCSDVGRR